MNKQRLASTALTALALAAASPLANAVSTWTFDASSCNGSGSGYETSWSCGSGATGVTASAWSTATSGGNEGSYRTADINLYDGSGFGVRNRESNSGDSGSPEHATDNQNGTDLIALSFGQKVTLSSLSVGWWSNDSDLSVLAYTGAGTPASLSNYSASTLLGAGSGWTLVGNYAGAGANQSINSANISSSWWLISAYNSNFGSGSGLGQGNDYVKLLAVAGEPYRPPTNPPPGVPEPGSLALAGIALAGAWQVRRRKTQATA